MAVLAGSLVFLLPVANAQSQSGGKETHKSQPAVSTNGRAKLRPFIGRVVRVKGLFLLQAGGMTFHLDKQYEASRYLGKDVEIKGKLSQQTNTIEVDNIAPFPPKS